MKKTALIVMLMFGCERPPQRSDLYKLEDGSCVHFTLIRGDNGCGSVIEPVKVGCPKAEAP